MNSWWHKDGQHAVPSRRSRSCPARPQVEVLEDRLAPAGTLFGGQASAVPIIHLPAQDFLAQGAVFSSSGSFTDPEGNAWKASVNYGDGSGIQPLPVQADHTFILNHVFSEQGSFQVSVTVADDLGGIGSAAEVVHTFGTDHSVADLTAKHDILGVPAYPPANIQHSLFTPMGSMNFSLPFQAGEWTPINQAPSTNRFAPAGLNVIGPSDQPGTELAQELTSETDTALGTTPEHGRTPTAADLKANKIKVIDYQVDDAALIPKTLGEWKSERVHHRRQTLSPDMKKMGFTRPAYNLRNGKKSLTITWKPQTLNREELVLRILEHRGPGQVVLAVLVLGWGTLPGLNIRARNRAGARISRFSWPKTKLGSLSGFDRSNDANAARAPPRNISSNRFSQSANNRGQTKGSARCFLRPMQLIRAMDW